MEIALEANCDNPGEAGGSGRHHDFAGLLGLVPPMIVWGRQRGSGGRG